MKELTGKLPHYYDTGEHAISRGLGAYELMVFKDNNMGWLGGRRPIHMVPDNLEQWSLRHYHTLEHLLPTQNGDKLSSYKDPQVQFEWDWKEGKIFGGFENFFAYGSLILDLGAGKGTATQEINERFGDRNVKCVGVDYRYALEQPQNPKHLVAGDFESLPFRDNSFNRILSVESFPRWLPKEEQTINRYISEITRISCPETIWRGTLPKYYEDDIIPIPTETLLRKFCENGWEVVANHSFFSAKLVVKKAPNPTLSAKEATL